MSAELLAALCGQLSANQPDWEQMLHDSSHCHTITFCNPLSLRVALDKPDFLSRLKEFDYVFPDGILLATAASRIRGKSLQRCSFDGNSLAGPIFDLLRRTGHSIALVGSTDETAAAAGEILRATGLSVTFTHGGYFADDSERCRCIDNLQSCEPKVVIVGMGAWHQEDFSLRLKQSGWQGVIFTCGGYLDQMVKIGPKYYPEWVNRWHLRAPYRLLQEPHKLLARYTRDYFPFYRAVIATYWRHFNS